MKPFKIELEGYDFVEKVVSDGGNSGRVLVSKKWLGKKVRVILIEPPEEGSSDQE